VPCHLGLVLEALRLGTRKSCGIRARATTLPSSSAAIALTDDVPMSIRP